MPKTVQISFRKKLRSVSDNKENSMDMGPNKTKQPVEKPEKASTLKNPKEENPLVPRRSKRRNALVDVVINSPEMQISKCARVKSKKLAVESKKTAKAVEKKPSKTNLTQAKLNFSPTSLSTRKDSSSVGNEEIADPQLDGTFCVTKSLYQEVESSPDLSSGVIDHCHWPTELLKACKADNTCQLENPVHDLIENKKAFNEDSILASDEACKSAKKDDTYELANSTMQVFIQNKKPLQEVNILTCATLPDGYWKELAEQRRITLEKILNENESLRDQVEVLQVEIAQLRNIVQQAEELATVVKGILE